MAKTTTKKKKTIKAPVKTIDQLTFARIIAQKYELPINTVLNIILEEQKLTMKYVDDGYKVIKKNYLTIYVVYNILKKEIITLLASIVLFISFKFAKFEEKRLVIKQVKTENKKEDVEKKTEDVSVKEITKESDVEDETEESTDIAEKLTKYKDLLEKGLITQEEYAETKKKILGI